jgi:hypothetical protein
VETLKILRKEKGNKRKLITIYLITFPLIILFGCVKKETSTLQPKGETLKERVTIYWNLKVNKEFDKTYNLEDPLYRNKVSLVRYINLNSNPLVEYKGFEIVNIVEDEDKADVELKITVRAKVPGARPFENDTVIKDQWIFHDGNWYHLTKATKKI